MQRRNFRNISNNFVQGGIVQGNMNSNQNNAAYQTRSTNITPIPQAPPAPALSVVPVKIEPVIIPTTASQSLASTSVASTSQTTLVSSVDVNSPMKYDDSSRSMSENDLMRLKKINFKKKVSGKEKRGRQNRKLFRMLTPRNAIAALNELHGQGLSESAVVPTLDSQFEAEITVNNVRHVGLGKTKMQAKNAASEKALRDIVISKFQQMKNQEATPQTAGNDLAMDDDKAEDDVPMMQLASFALYKLFAEWEAEGYEIPMPKVNYEALHTMGSINAPEPAQGPAKTPKAPKIRTELPPNSEGMHPVMLLSIMRPCTQYSDLGSQGVTPNIVHTVGATVDGQNFIGQGRSKKEARKKVATDILIKLFEWRGTC